MPVSCSQKWKEKGTYLRLRPCALLPHCALALHQDGTDSFLPTLVSHWRGLRAAPAENQDRKWAGQGVGSSHLCIARSFWAGCKALQKARVFHRFG